MEEQSNTFMRFASPNERRTISREDLDFYKSVVVGAVYDLAGIDLDLRCTGSYSIPLRECCETHPFLNVIVRDQATEKPYYERVSVVKLADHIIIAKDLVVQDGASATETKAIEAILDSTVDRSWLSDRPPWRLLVHPIRSTQNAKPTRCFMAFSYSHVLGDGLAGPIFHHTFLNAMRLTTPTRREADGTNPSKQLPLAFDTPERLSISWGFLLGPLAAVLLPKSIAKFIGLRAATSQVNEGTWLGPPMFYEPDTPTQTKLLEVDNGMLQKALQAARRNNAKLTATLHQVIVRALSQAIPESSASNFCSGTAINMRSSIGASDSEIGLYVTGYYQQFPRDDSSGPLSAAQWSAARSMTQKLAETATQLHDQPIGLLRYAPSIRGYLTGKLGQARDSSYEISNLVAFSDATADIKCNITKMIFTTSCSVVAAPLTFNVVSVKGGSLTIAVTWQTGAIGVQRQDEKAFVQGICDSVLSGLTGL